MKIGDLVKPTANQSGISNDPRVIGVITEKHKFWHNCWFVYWSYKDLSCHFGMGSAYEDSLRVISESR